MSIDKKKWNDDFSRCKRADEKFEPYHKWFVISKIRTPGAEIVTGIMCGVCFHELMISEAHKYRD